MSKDPEAVRGKTRCWSCSAAVAADPRMWRWFGSPDQVDRATGRDGMCTGCRHYRRAGKKIDRWDAKQDAHSPPNAWLSFADRVADIDIWLQIVNAPRPTRPAARWRAKSYRRNRRKAR